MGDDITIGVTEIVNNIEVTAQPNDQIVDISVTDNADNLTLNITPTVVEVNINKGGSFAKWGDLYGTLSDQTDLQNALNLKANLVGGKVPASELPSYVDDIIEVVNYAALPATGEIGKIYVTLDNNKIYRWSGSVYIEIASNSAIWGAITGTLSSQTDLQNALNAKQNTITLTTTGTSGSATLVGSTLNIPNYTTDISGLVPYTGATGNVDLGTHKLTASDLVVNHASGSGVAASITKGGSGEALTVTKSSGSGNAASILGGVTLLDELHLNTDLADAYIASAATWNAKQAALTFSSPLVNTSGTISIPAASGSVNGYLSSTDWTTFNTKQNALTNPITGTGTTNYLPKFTGSTALGNSLIYDSGTNIGIGTTSPDNGKLTILKNTSRATESSYGIAIQSNTLNAYTELLLGADDTVDCGIIQTAGKNTSFTSKKLALQPQGGNVGIGTTSPVNPLTVQSNGSAQAIAILNRSSDDFSNLLFYNYAGSSVLGGIGNSSGRIRIMTGGVGDTYERLSITSGGNVGIGTTSPNSILTIGSTDATAVLTAGGGNTHLTLKAMGSQGELIFGAGGVSNGVAGSERMRIFSSGNVFIGASPTDAGYKLDVNGGSAFRDTLRMVASGVDAAYLSWTGSNTGVLTLLHSGAAGTQILASGASTFNGTVTATGFFNSSDNRLKDLIDYDYNVSDIKPITYLWKDGRDNKKHVGYSAQEVQKVMPDAVNEDEKGFLSVNYVEVLVAKISQMEKEIAYLKSKI